ncbi:hypothetical protein K7432_003567 [Basidiobolus ranarum]|uniref:NodB homology domain-containing protein n=1 Tax=Basidiobolus ranarum TaxID=34480 RepID=A0ABR2W601_9FUNG
MKFICLTLLQSLFTILPNVAAVPVGQVINTCSIPGTFAMTFDDGPSKYTQQLLSSLKAKGTKATFFVVGEMIKDPKQAAAMKQAYMDGHQIALHTYTPPHLNSLSSSLVQKQIDQSMTAVYNVIGKRPRYFRCPYGECNSQTLQILARNNLVVVGWNLDTLDWKTKSAAATLKAYEKGLSKAAPQSTFIALEHEITKSTVQVVDKLIDAVTSKKLRLSRVVDCLGESNPYF